MSTGKIFVISGPTGNVQEFIAAIEDITGDTDCGIEVVEAIPIEPLPKMEPVQLKPIGYGKPQTKNLSRWR